MLKNRGENSSKCFQKRQKKSTCSKNKFSLSCCFFFVWKYLYLEGAEITNSKKNLCKLSVKPILPCVREGKAATTLPSPRLQAASRPGPQQCLRGPPACLGTCGRSPEPSAGGITAPSTDLAEGQIAHNVLRCFRWVPKAHSARQLCSYHNKDLCCRDFSNCSFQYALNLGSLIKFIPYKRKWKFASQCTYKST